MHRYFDYMLRVAANHRLALRKRAGDQRAPDAAALSDAQILPYAVLTTAETYYRFGQFTAALEHLGEAVQVRSLRHCKNAILILIFCARS